MVEPIGRLRAVVLDCPDPRALSRFYQQLLGGEVTSEEDDWVSLSDGDTVLLSFQAVEDHRPPAWPDGDPPQQFHIDVTVTDIASAEAAAVALGAQRHPHQPPEADNWRVYLDPAGHPFCLVWDR